MAMTNGEASAVPGEELTIIRIYDAPRDLLFDLWTDPKHIAQWWGPRMFTSEVYEWDARPGGAIHLAMIGPDGVPNPMRGAFETVDAPEWLVFNGTALHDADGIPALATRNTIAFDENEDGGTIMTVTIVVTRATDEAKDALAGMEVGWNQTLDKLAEYLVASAS